MNPDYYLIFFGLLELIFISKSAVLIRQHKTYKKMSW